jgi:protein TonB
MMLHGALIAGAVVASGKAIIPEREKIEEHSILYVAPPPPKVYVAPEPLPEVKRPPTPKAQSRPQPPRMRAAPPPPRQAPTPRPAQPQPAIPAAPLVAPIAVPVSIPDIDSKALPTVADIPIPPAPVSQASSGSSRGAVKGTSDGDVDGESRGKGLGSGASNKAYSENQVERAVVATRPAVPRYPEALKSVNVQGEVIAQYIVDARGRVEPGSIKILSATHKLFGDAVRTALLEARFRPAEVGGNKVRQLVEQPFIFKLQ